MTSDITELTVQITAAYVSNNQLPVSGLPDLIRSVREALVSTGAAQLDPEKVDLKPAVSIKKSVQPDYIVCLEDGKQLKMLKRHLKTAYGMSPDEYRAKWGLPADYPMVAPNYAKARSAMALEIGLGRRKAE